MPVRYWPMLVDGKDHEGSTGTFERVSPAHDVVVGRYAQAGIEDVDAAVAAAHAAFDGGPWRWRAGAEKARVLRRVATAIADERDDLARTEVLESGKPIGQAREEMASAAEIWFYAATLAQHAHGDAHNGIGPDHLALVLREPIGVVGVVTPWNFPLLIASQKIPFALAAGCSVVVKASELTPGTTTRLLQILREAGLPDGVANIVHGGGDIGAYLSSHPGTDMTSFTGSTAVGKAVMRSAAETLKHVSLELGGKNPQVVLADADLEKAARSVSWAAWFNQGECCNAGSRLLVQAEIAGDFVQRLVALTREVRVGDPLAEDTEIGAIISDEHLERIDGYVRTGGGRVATGGARITTEVGRYYSPTVLDDVAPGSPVATEEIFGPVLSVLRFDDLADAVRLTNDTGYGLSSGVWTSDVDAAIGYARAVRAGTVWINDWMAGFPEVPFGGVGRSGIGRELGRSALDEFTETKSVVLRAGAAIGVRGTRVPGLT